MRRRASRNVPSSIRLDHGDVLVMDGLAQSEYEHCTASELQGPRVNLTYRWVAQHTASCPLADVVGCVLPTCAQGLVEPSSRWLGDGENKWSSFWGLVLLLLILVSVLLVSTWIHIRRGHRHGGQRLSCSAPLGVVPVDLGDGVGDCTSPIFQRCVFLFPFCIFLGEQAVLFFQEKSFGFTLLLGMLVAKWVPTPCYNDAYSVGIPTWAFWEKDWQKHCKTMVSTFLGPFFLVSKTSIFFFLVFFYGCFISGGPGILGLALVILLLVSCLLNLLMWEAG